jgi:hypothetical protein
VRLLAHMASSFIAAPANSPLALFRTMMVNPAALKDTYFPTMPEDPTKMAQVCHDDDDDDDDDDGGDDSDDDKAS